MFVFYIVIELFKSYVLFYIVIEIVLFKNYVVIELFKIYIKVMFIFYIYTEFKSEKKGIRVRTGIIFHNLVLKTINYSTISFLFFRNI